MQHNLKLRRLVGLAGSVAEPDSALAAENSAAAPSESQPVRQLQLFLEERLRQPPKVEPGRAEPISEPVSAENTSQEAALAAKSKIPTRLIKAVLGLAIVGLFGWVPLQTLLQSSSVEAIVNSRVVTVRAPIEGEIVATPSDLAATGVIARDKPLLRIRNVRADRSRLDDLTDRLGRLDIERPALEAKIVSLQAAHDALVRDVALFTAGRITQLEARAAELKSEIAVAQARRDVAQAAAERAVALAKSNTVSAAELQRLTLEGTIAEQIEVGAERQLDAASVELEAAQSGTFIGDSYNDMPSSAQRRDEFRQRLDELTADRNAMVAHIAWLRQAIADESERYEAVSDVAVSLPVAGRIWEVMTAPGEQVRVGQDLLKILDCSGAVVTANVTEAVYNQLRVGAPARFRPTDGGADLDGVVTNLTGFADAPANLAILPSALSREPYRVTVRAPELESELNCAIGRTGRVLFDKARAEAR